LTGRFIKRNENHDTAQKRIYLQLLGPSTNQKGRKCGDFPPLPRFQTWGGAIMRSSESERALRGLFLERKFRLAAGADVISVWGGARETIILKSDGTVWKWGRNDVGEMGNGIADGANVFTPHPAPAQVQADSSGAAFDKVKFTAARDYHNIAVKTDGSVWMWGANDQGQCGVNNTNNVWRPAPVVGFLGVYPR